MIEKLKDAIYDIEHTKFFYLLIKSICIRSAGKSLNCKIGRRFTADFKSLLPYGTCGPQNG